nr:truncated ORF1 [Porcine circovirus]
MPSKKSGRSGPQPHKRWVFTLNNPSEDERKKIRELPISLFDYFIVGEEGNEEGRTPHLQGFANHLGFKWGALKIKFSELYIHGYTDIVVLVVYTVFERSAEAYMVYISSSL